MQKLKVIWLENEELSESLSSKPEVGQAVGFACFACCPDFCLSMLCLPEPFNFIFATPLIIMCREREPVWPGGKALGW